MRRSMLRGHVLQTSPLRRRLMAAIILLTLGAVANAWLPNREQGEAAPEAPPVKVYDSTTEVVSHIVGMDVGPQDWPMWGGSPLRNNVPRGKNIPADWDIQAGRNIKWRAQLGSQTYGNPVVAKGKIFIGTNNGAGYLERFPSTTDLGVLLCFNENDGRFLWQHSSPKLPTGRVHDWPLQGVCSTPLVDGGRLWFTTNRCEIVCLDVEGFRDGENDGPFRDEQNENLDEADVIWKFDMIKELGVSPHNMSACSPICVGETLFINTSNGLDQTHVNLPAPDAPSFIALDRNTAQVLWTDRSPGRNILHAQWSSPSYAVLGGVPQVLFAGGDGWLYSFRADKWADKRPTLLWKFDCNPKDSQYTLGGRATRNQIIAYPVVYDGLVYIAVGEDPEHGEGDGHLWCIDPAKKLDGSDVSPELAIGPDGKIIPHRRERAVDPKQGEKAIPNPSSAAVWHYSQHDLNGDGKILFEETFHRSLGIPVIKDNVLYVSDFSGLFHCVNAKTGKPHWTYDMLAAAWGSALLVDGKIFIGDEDGDVSVFRHSADPAVAMERGDRLNGIAFTPRGTELQLRPHAEINLGSSIYGTPIVANDVLYFAGKDTLFAISPGSGENWPQWRGPRGNGISAHADVPIRWSRDENVLWRTPLPGSSGATPVLWHNRMFVMSDDGGKLVLICLDTDGQILWSRNCGVADRVSRGETYIVAASPLTDGEFVWAIDKNGKLSCFDFEGKSVWTVDLQERYGKLHLQFGWASTPVIDNRCLYLQLIQGDGDPETTEAVVFALSKRTGEERWKHVRRTAARQESQHSYASPVLNYRDGVADLLLTHGADALVAHRLADGREVWRVDGWNPPSDYNPTLRQIASPVLADGWIIVPTAKNGPVFALHEKIDANENRVAWRREQNTPDTASPLVHEGLVYLCRESGRLLCLELSTGKEIYHERLDNERCRVSPVLAGGRLYVSTSGGTTYVIKAGRQFEVLARNELREPIASSPVVASGRIYLRTSDALWAIGNK